PTVDGLHGGVGAFDRKGRRGTAERIDPICRVAKLDNDWAVSSLFENRLDAGVFVHLDALDLCRHDCHLSCCQVLQVILLSLSYHPVLPEGVAERTLWRWHLPHRVQGLA